MFTARWRLFRLLGIPISVDASWLIILALVSWTLAEMFRRQVPGLVSADYWVMGVITAVSFFVCVVLHELGHALTAKRFGIRTRDITFAAHRRCRAAGANS